MRDGILNIVFVSVFVATVLDILYISTDKKIIQIMNAIFSIRFDELFSICF